MIKFIVKSLLYLTVSFMVFSFPWGERELFEHINDRTGPYTRRAYGRVGNEIKKYVHKGVSFGKKLFSNSNPIGKIEEYAREKEASLDPELLGPESEDSIREELSGLKRDGINSDVYTAEERARLQEKLNQSANKKGH